MEVLCWLLSDTLTVWGAGRMRITLHHPAPLTRPEISVNLQCNRFPGESDIYSTLTAIGVCKRYAILEAKISLLTAIQRMVSTGTLDIGRPVHY